MKILITGAKGMLGSDISRILEQKHSVIPLSKQDLNITERDDTINTIKSHSPDIIINCAAFTMVDLAENEKDKAFLVNGTGVQNLALASEELKIPICHISTDYVFDGTKKSPYTPFDITNPVNTYGASKLAGEKYIQWVSRRFYIVRTSWLYGRQGSNFVKTILKLTKEREDIKIIHDQIGSPTWTVTLSKGIEKLIETGAYGIYNITDDSEGGKSWYDFAREIISLINGNVRATPIPTEEYSTPAQRPKYSVLDMSLNSHIFGSNAVGWKNALREFLESI